MRPATAEEKALAAQQPVVIASSIPVRPSDTPTRDDNTAQESKV